MVRRGARNLILLNRSGVKTLAAQALLKELTESKVNVKAPACDTADACALEAVLHECTGTMPPIRGCIHSAAVLADRTFEQMTLSEWSNAVRPKVQASWNLHNLLPRNLDFFIMFSSVSGIIGGNSQCNYAAGNTYMDALSQYRISHGEKATSMALGLFTEDGMIATNQQVLDRLVATGQYIPVSMQQLLGLLDYYCDPSLPSIPLTTSNPIIGLRKPADVLATGVDLLEHMHLPLWRHLRAAPRSGKDEAPAVQSNMSDESNISAKLSRVTSLAESSELITQALVAHVAHLVAMPVAKLDATKPLQMYGIDSLTVMNLRNWVQKTLNVDIAVFDILGTASLEAVGHTVGRKRSEQARHGC